MYAPNHLLDLFAVKIRCNNFYRSWIRFGFEYNKDKI